MSNNVANKIVVITGASSGLGAEAARHLAAQGATVVLGARREDRICEAQGIEHHLTKPNHLWTNGQVARMNRTVKDSNHQALPSRQP